MFPAGINRLGLVLVIAAWMGASTRGQDAPPSTSPNSTADTKPTTQAANPTPPSANPTPSPVNPTPPAVNTTSPSTGAAAERAGRVTGDAVYVRSGPSPDYYVVTKLNSGDEVTITGEEGPWLSIKPPRGCFSLISREYVDTSDGVHGVVNGDRVNVRCGSHITADQYTVQAQLSRGAEVSILGENEDGKYRIVPPPNARVFISKQFVHVRTPGEPDEPAPRATSDSATGTSGKSYAGTTGTTGTAPPQPSALTGVVPVTPSPLPASVNPEDAMLLGTSPSPLRQRLVDLNARMREQMSRPMAQRDLPSLAADYGQIAADSSDELASKFAAARVAQLEYMSKLGQSMATLGSISRDIEKEREIYIDARKKVAAPLTAPRAGFDAEGELRPSAVYAGAIGPRRLRLVDPKTQPARTIGYVELGEGLANLDVDRYLGRYVGIEASRTRPAEGTMNPVPLYTASRIVILKPEGEEGTSASEAPTNKEPARQP